MNMKIGTMSSNRSRKKKGGHASPSVDACTGYTMLRINSIVAIFFRPQGSFYKR
jgi:hypothetical protein